MLLSNLVPFNINKVLFRFLTTGILAATGLFGILVIEVSFPFSRISSVAHAQDYTQNEVTSYAKAGYEVELLRQRVYKEIKSMLNQAPPDIVCNRPETFENLPDNVRDTVSQYCDDSERIVQRHNLSIDRFNQLKSFYDRGGEFYQQVQNVLKEF
ncbi:MAG: DUF4168 domain-containing protein [Xenococcaceae cyanobacterium MO_188.B29]|nr:DUF4168 domain-containing protein [Xenococcaceae cyanobacterium MO_188.B29]